MKLLRLYRIVFLCIFVFHTVGLISKTIVDGLEYDSFEKNHNFSFPLVTHVLKVDPKKIDIFAAHAFKKGTERDALSNIVKNNGAIAGINCGFFRRGGTYNGNSLGLLKIGNNIFSDTGCSRCVLAWNHFDFLPFIGQLNTIWQLTINGKNFPIDSINQPRKTNKAVIYLPEFHNTTLTSPEGAEIIVEHNNVINIFNNNTGNHIIPSNGFVYSIGPHANINISSIKRTDPITLSYSFQLSLDSNNNITPKNIDFIISGAGLLISNGKTQSKEQMLSEMSLGKEITQTSDEIIMNFHNPKEAEWLIDGRHPRTAIGINKNKNWILVVVEGRQPDRSNGLSLPELAEYMKTLGCTDAINLGGGGDSEMIVNSEIVNIPSGGSTGFASKLERPISDAILLQSHIAT